MKFLNKSNESYEMDDINDFCELHELDIKALRKVINGEMKTHRGFRLADPKLNNPYTSRIEKLEAEVLELRNFLEPILKEREKARQRHQEENPGSFKFGRKAD